MLPVAVVVSFFICWLPFHAQRLLASYLAKEANQNPFLLDVYSKLTYISGIMYYLSSTINPLLYQLMSAKFRLAFKETFKCSLFKCLHLGEPDSSTQGSRRPSRQTTMVTSQPAPSGRSNHHQAHSPNLNHSNNNNPTSNTSHHSHLSAQLANCRQISVPSCQRTESACSGCQEQETDAADPRLGRTNRPEMGQESSNWWRIPLAKVARKLALADGPATRCRIGRNKQLQVPGQDHNRGCGGERAAPTSPLLADDEQPEVRIITKETSDQDSGVVTKRAATLIEVGLDREEQIAFARTGSKDSPLALDALSPGRTSRLSAARRTTNEATDGALGRGAQALLSRLSSQDEEEEQLAHLHQEPRLVRDHNSDSTTSSKISQSVGPNKCLIGDQLAFNMDESPSLSCSSQVSNCSHSKAIVGQPGEEEGTSQVENGLAAHNILCSSPTKTNNGRMAKRQRRRSLQGSACWEQAATATRPPNQRSLKAINQVLTHSHHQSRANSRSRLQRKLSSASSQRGPNTEPGSNSLSGSSSERQLDYRSAGVEGATRTKELSQSSNTSALDSGSYTTNNSHLTNSNQQLNSLVGSLTQSDCCPLSQAMDRDGARGTVLSGKTVECPAINSNPNTIANQQTESNNNNNSNEGLNAPFVAMR